MTDVRLTALNPEDSTVVPVACNSSGELLVDKGEVGPDLNLEGDLSVGGRITAVGSVKSTNGSGVAFLGATSGTGLAINDSGNNTVIELNYDGSAEFAGDVTIGKTTSGASDIGARFIKGSISQLLSLDCVGGGSSDVAYQVNNNGSSTAQIKTDGSAEFKGDVVVGSRSKSWMLVEQGGLCHMVEQTRSLIDEGFSVDADYPKLRDVFNELDLIERSLSQVMEKLRLTPPAGWPVWDGSDETQ
jgi:hypothetical protein